MDEERKRIADAFIDALVLAIAAEWYSLPDVIAAPLESAVLSGVAQGALQLDQTMDEAEEAASQFAAERSAELVGLQRDDEGGLIEDEDATWSIAETTREKIEQIVMAEFSKDLPLDETMKNIQTALEAQTLGSGIFSEKRAQLISETEVTNAQVGGHYQAWAQAGVRRVKWITAEDERTCIPCARNDRVVRKMGERFPSGDLHPGGHPHCRCSLELIR